MAIPTQRRPFPRQRLLVAVLVLCRLEGTLFTSVAALGPDGGDGVAVEGARDAQSRQCEQPTKSPFQIIIDGGSTGSRLHIYEFLDRPAPTEEDPTKTEPVILRRGSAKAWTPLSAHAPLPTKASYRATLDPATVAEHLLPTFEYAASLIPQQYHRATPVMYQATAGMRLLDEDDQHAVYDALYQGLSNSVLNVGDEDVKEQIPFPFRLKRENLATLDGQSEGLFGAIAANYLSGRIDAKLHFTQAKAKSIGYEVGDDDIQECANPEMGADSPSYSHGSPVGALDMGGSSTQIVFLPGAKTSTNSTNCKPKGTLPTSSNFTLPETDQSPRKLEGDHFFSTSYLSYGVDQFRERLWNLWIQDEIRQHTSISNSTSSIENPCSFTGNEIQWREWSLIGTGDARKCVEQVKRLIPHHDAHESHVHTNKSRMVGGIRHPPIRGKFFAMSLYFFTLDCLRELSTPNKEAHEALNLSWPTPSIEELDNALDGFCARNWHNDLLHIQDSAHKFTRASVLPHRCIEAVYMVTLLKDGFGFLPSSRDITFAYDVGGSEVEWTLGMALSVNAASSSEDGAGLTDGNVESDDGDAWSWRDQVMFGFGLLRGDSSEGENMTEQEESVGVAYFLDMYGYAPAASASLSSASQ